jgi:hypothetical protein
VRARSLQSPTGSRLPSPTAVHLVLTSQNYGCMGARRGAEELASEPVFIIWAT